MENALEFINEATNLDVSSSTLKKFLSEVSNGALHLGLRVVLAIVFFLIGVQLIKGIRKIIKHSMQRANAEVGAIQFVDSFVKAALYVILVVALATSCGVDAASTVAVLGSAGVAIGLAVQGSLSNLAGGVLLLMLKPFKVGDYIIESHTGKEGFVKEIHIFFTKLLTYDNQTVVLPNGSLANNSLVNVTAQDCRRIDIIVPISYKADLRRAKEVLAEVLEKDDAVIKNKEHIVFVNQLGESSVDLGVRCWFKQSDFWPGKWRVTENCKLALDAAGIEIPFNQLDVHLDTIETTGKK